MSPSAAAIALLVSAAVGYLTIDAMMRLLERVVFWNVCVAFGALAILGGGLLVAI